MDWAGWTSRDRRGAMRRASSDDGPVMLVAGERFHKVQRSSAFARAMFIMRCSEAAGPMRGPR